MIKQYNTIKSKYRDSILFFRLGDFYEMFNEDAKRAASILDLVLTSRGKGASSKVPMCGIPYHAAEGYIARLVKAGYKVAICDQVEDPSTAKGIVRRDVTRVITSGTYIDEDDSSPRLIISVFPEGARTGLSFTDVSSGTLQTALFTDRYKFAETVARLPVCECVFPSEKESDVRDLFSMPALVNKNIAMAPFDDWTFQRDVAFRTLTEHFRVGNLKGFGIDEESAAISSTGGLLEYLKQMNRQPLKHIDKVSIYSYLNHMIISAAAIKGLQVDELTKAVDNTKTPMGRRCLRSWIYQPLVSEEAIKTRQSAIERLISDTYMQKGIAESLKNSPDIDKALSRISCGYTNVKDLLALRSFMVRVPEIRNLLKGKALNNPYFEISDVKEIRELLEQAVNPDCPTSHHEGKIIREGFNEEMDRIRAVQSDRREWLRNFQAEEIKRTGINSLKVGFNRVFGYYLEVTKSNLRLVPEDYIRKQTLVGSERFITPQLKEFEEKMLSADQRVAELEENILGRIREKILDNSALLHKLSREISELDTIYSLSILALRPGYIRPNISSGHLIDIREGRHPIVEHHMDREFIPNDTLLDDEENHMLIITGPNMAGKSTYIRQTALLVILAQTGSFIPARQADIGIVDKIFTRIGAHDEIMKGYSTFMVEMSETADILNNMTEKTLIILDEVGRGTSTYDGLSLAWAIAEHLSKSRVRSLFATHFHEVTSLAEEYSGVKNYNITVRRWKDEIVFLHKIAPGSTDDSYGIYVAKLAGVPVKVLARAEEILKNLESHGNVIDKVKNRSGSPTEDFFTDQHLREDTSWQEIKNILEDIRIDAITPLEALNILSSIIERTKRERDLYGKSTGAFQADNK